jgi:predicted nucleotidyltransferase
VARHHGRSVALSGSVARGEERTGTDMDFLVDFEPGTRAFEGPLLGAELEEALGVPVDIGTLEPPSRASTPRGVRRGGASVNRADEARLAGVAARSTRTTAVAVVKGQQPGAGAG